MNPIVESRVCQIDEVATRDRHLVRVELKTVKEVNTKDLMEKRGLGIDNVGGV